MSKLCQNCANGVLREGRMTYSCSALQTPYEHVNSGYCPFFLTFAEKETARKKAKQRALSLKYISESGRYLGPFYVKPDGTADIGEWLKSLVERDIVPEIIYDRYMVRTEGVFGG